MTQTNSDDMKHITSMSRPVIEKKNVKPKVLYHFSTGNNGLDFIYLSTSQVMKRVMCLFTIASKMIASKMIASKMIASKMIASKMIASKQCLFVNPKQAALLQIGMAGGGGGIFILSSILPSLCNFCFDGPIDLKFGM